MSYNNSSTSTSQRPSDWPLTQEATEALKKANSLTLGLTLPPDTQDPEYPVNQISEQTILSHSDFPGWLTVSASHGSMNGLGAGEDYSFNVPKGYRPVTSVQRYQNWNGEHVLPCHLDSFNEKETGYLEAFVHTMGLVPIGGPVQSSDSGRGEHNTNLPFGEETDEDTEDGEEDQEIMSIGSNVEMDEEEKEVGENNGEDDNVLAWGNVRGEEVGRAVNYFHKI
ncbi:hypothetical protein TREMEDRAFT_58770 [Tremella mesenterica DSM 1558]|uniref:uncharacterized protein n=1 Tax=Tremella mesenterica (strain ATCC 24925 / CBS 8224 / DSM 1558 / NBRC 9311 / NRRL Y-6157 / RJB 2259-6 / UBC 559-6) TaxID=578456 RepID=UPI0003F48C98|nr:uncharacterized protein TREMEDRAFT_58770 [Tremella mesenterica DSM 1558]EIW72599.1 hypothetical protein TREMEDRAFT_58770 [Tremella mesenterica DSM 1558]